MLSLTALIITFDEKENIERTLAALQWAPEVLLIDSFSRDATVALAQASHPGVRVVQRQFDSFAGQCNFGLSQVTTPWVLSLDADYVVTPELAREIAALEDDSSVAGYRAGFRYCVWGHPLRSTIYPPRVVLYRRDAATYRDEGHGHRVAIKGRVVELAGKIDHDDRKPLSRWLGSQDRYTMREGAHLLAQPFDHLSAQDRLRLRIYFAAPVMLVYLLFGRGLILDGWRGWFYVAQRTLAELLLSLRLLALRHRLEGIRQRSPTAEAPAPEIAADTVERLL